MKYLLDTDILSFVARDADAALTERVRAADADQLGLSVITRGEIEFGLAARPPRRLTLTRMRGLLAAIATLPLQAACAEHYCRLRLVLSQAGTPIGGNDMWIAAHALCEGLVLVTNNEREFRRVPGLKVENWLR